MHHASMASASEDARELVVFPEPLKAHTLANMRDHLKALGEIQQYLAASQYAQAAEVAEQRLGMSSMDDHGANHVAGFMPVGMQAAGTQMHQQASRLALTLQDLEVTQDYPAAFKALAGVTQTCVACHSSYRLQ